jgi:hypothetical protein
MDPIRRVNTTMPESLLRKVDLYSEMNYEDRATAIRQLVAEGLRVKLEKAVLEQYKEGRITLRQGAEMLEVPYLRMNEIVEANQLPLVSDPGEAYEGAARIAGPNRRRRSKRKV